jgi:hypothetical protein
VADALALLRPRIGGTGPKNRRVVVRRYTRPAAAARLAAKPIMTRIDDTM